MSRLFVLCLLLASLFQCASTEDILPPGMGEEEMASDRIRLNQMGIYPNSTLRFSIIAWEGTTDTLPDGQPAPVAEEPAAWYVTAEEGKVIIADGQVGELMDWSELGGVKAWYVETPAPAEGSYRIYVPGVGYSHEFDVREGVYRKALLGSMHSNYLQRMSIDLPEEFAGPYARKAGHPDTRVKFHPSSGRTGYTSSPGGWYDAGDYGKYVLNASFPLAQYLTLREDAGLQIREGDLQVPERTNGVEDYLDELRYELDWLLTMQDRDGGMFHKLTTLNFDKMIMPEETTEQRYIIGKSTEATLNFAAAAAQASRVWTDVDDKYAATLLKASIRAYTWAVENPEMGFTNPEDVTTGQYGDTDWSSERAFAAAELYITTGEEKYLDAFMADYPGDPFRAGGGWKTFMGQMALFTLTRFPDGVPAEVYDRAKADILTTADSLVAEAERLPFHQPISVFNWGSNSDVLNAAMLVATANRLDPKPEYRDMIQASVDYVLGHNAVGYSYVTGFGDRTPMFIHHRPSIADDVAEPFPGFLSGGPNPKQQDAAWATYPARAAPMQSWTDQEGSYASNEICLNWNAPLTYVLGYLEALNNR
ncbi:hypothetical protein A3850_006765 [Lewinella sp. 4G2]|nr:hypothetical protein A3850_006765 [Lewinella sp. 4G2]